jgi:hypothetical protein
MAAIQTQTELDADSFSLYIEVTGKPVNPRRELLKERTSPRNRNKHKHDECGANIDPGRRTNIPLRSILDR